MNQKGFSPLFIILGIILAIGIAGGTYYLGAAKDQSKSQVQVVTQSPTPPTQTTPAPIPAATNLQPILEEIKVIDGSVYKVSPSGKQDILIKKGVYKPLGYGVNFAQAILSLDKSKILLLGYGGITIPFLYYTYLDKIDIQFIDNAKEAVWSHNSRYIAYINGPTDALTNSWVYVYDTKMNKKITIVDNIVSQPKIQNLSVDYFTFGNIRWLDDDMSIQLNYTAYKGNMPRGEKVDGGNIILPVVTEK